MKQLATYLRQAGKESVPLVFPDGSRLLVLPFGGRVLGLFADGSEMNFLWTNAALAGAKSARAYFAREGWSNPGGDRTWVAPEIDFFVSDPARVMETYRVPRRLDPGAWRIENRSATGVSLVNDTRVPRRPPLAPVAMRIAKSIGPAPSPLRYTALAALPVQYAGYTQRTTLDVAPSAGAGEPAQVGLWNLLQLPPPGDMLIGTYCRAEPVIVFGRIPGNDIKVNPRCVRWKMGLGRTDAKITLKAAPLTGRAGYLYAGRGRKEHNLVIRQFAVNPSGDYVDTPWATPSDRGYAFQACSVRSGVERFNELEYHVPAVTAVEGRNRCADESQVWAFRGKAAEIAAVADLLLGAGHVVPGCRKR